MKKAFDEFLAKHWLLVLGIFAVIAIGFIGFAFVLIDQTAVQDPTAEVEVAEAVAPEPEPTATMPPLLARAEECFTRCKGIGLVRKGSPEIKLPERFSDLLKKPSFQSSFDALIAQWPPEFAGLAHRREGERDSMELGGSARGLLTTPSGRQVLVYDHVGYPAQEWVPSEEYRRPEGILAVAVDVASGAMAGIFNEGNDLDAYRFNGDEELLAPLLSFMIADDFHVARLAEAHFPRDAPELAFPLSGDELAEATARLRYLGDHFKDGMITGTRTVLAIREEEAEAAGKYWFSPNSDFTACNRNSGPSEKLEEFVGHTDQPTTKDFYDAGGNLTKVEVINSAGYGRETYWTFYVDCH